MKKKYNIDVYCLCWNEIKIIPFVIDYWKRFARHVYVYDNGSDDGSIELLESYDWITVRHFDSDGINELAYLQIKNNCWKGSDADLVIVCDMDECVFCKDWDKLYNEMVLGGYSVCKPHWINLVSMDFPKYEEGKLMHEYVTQGEDNENSKPMIIIPSKLIEINFCVGAHLCKPQPKSDLLVKNKDVILFHLKSLSPQYESERRTVFKKRLSNINRQMGWAYHYLDDSLENMIKDYKRKKTYNVSIREDL